MVVGNVLKNWFIKKIGWPIRRILGYSFKEANMLLLEKLPPLQLLIIKKELIISNILLKVGFSKFTIPLILLFL